MGWTLVDLVNIRKEMLVDVMRIAYCVVATTRLADQIKQADEAIDI